MIIFVNVTEPSFAASRFYSGAVRVFMDGLWVDYVGSQPTDTEVQQFVDGNIINLQESGGYTVPSNCSVIACGVYEIASGQILDILTGGVFDVI